MLGYQTEVPEFLAADLLEIVGSSEDFDSLPDSVGVNSRARGPSDAKWKARAAAKEYGVT
jgi:hypothetical protein